MDSRRHALYLVRSAHTETFSDSLKRRATDSRPKHAKDSHSAAVATALFRRVEGPLGGTVGGIADQVDVQYRPTLSTSGRRSIPAASIEPKFAPSQWGIGTAAMQLRLEATTQTSRTARAWCSSGWQTAGRSGGRDL